MHYESELHATIARLDQQGLPRPTAMIVAGSGLSVDLGEPLAELPLGDLLPFETHRIAGHPLAAQILECPEGTVLYFKGRLHAYQGYSAAQVVFCVRLGALLGVRSLLISNAAGCLDADASPGDLYLLSDQLNLTGRNPLCGSPPEAWGPRFPDMSEAFDPGLRQLARSLAEHQGLPLRSGVYAGLLGPTYETPAEVRMLGTLGAQLVGMSTVLEVIAARHMGVRCLGFSLATNLAAGVSNEQLDHQEVLDAGKQAASGVAQLIQKLIASPELHTGDSRFPSQGAS